MRKKKQRKPKIHISIDIEIDIIIIIELMLISKKNNVIGIINMVGRISLLHETCVTCPNGSVRTNIFSSR